jgi:GR25 family glycosyltransferase involved in LPS biosynthesis
MKNSLNQLEIDHMYYVNLEGSTEKNEHCIKLFSKHEFDVERVDAVSDSGYETTGRMLSTYKAQNQSVINTLKDAISNGYHRIVMFEDDVAFTDDAGKVFAESVERITELKTIIDDLDKEIYALDEEGAITEEVIGYEQKEHIEMVAHIPDNWDFISLGCLANGAPPYHLGGRVWGLSYCALAHANIYRDTMYQPLIDELEKMELPYDMCVAKVFRDFDKYKAVGILYKGIAYQKAGFRSDNLKIDNYDNSEVT